jgi:hypothetical protein
MSKYPELLKNVEAAKFLGVSSDMLCQSRCSGELFKGVPAPKFIKLGTGIRYPLENLESWVQSQCQYQNNAEVRLAQAAGRRCEV